VLHPKAYIIAGPTAVGKTATAVALAKRLNTSILSADSRQCYTEMNIGTAKPTPQELHEVKHYFINEYSVKLPINAADYEHLALHYLEEIFASHNVAVVCGGTGLYIKSLTEGLDEMPAIDDAVASYVNEQYRQNGLSWLQEQIQKEDPEFYDKGEIRNPARLIRALVFRLSTGHSILAYRTHQPKERYFEMEKIAIGLPMDVLYDRIDKRVDAMMAQGLLEEVKRLYSYRHLPSLHTVGYTELFDYIEGRYTLDEAISKIKQNTRNYAKRQMTWFRRDKTFKWYYADDPDLVDKILGNEAI
jgi:tRNA dimethylallyltransferase